MLLSFNKCGAFSGYAFQIKLMKTEKKMQQWLKKKEKKNQSVPFTSLKNQLNAFFFLSFFTLYNTISLRIKDL